MMAAVTHLVMMGYFAKNNKYIETRGGPWNGQHVEELASEIAAKTEDETAFESEDETGEEIRGLMEHEKASKIEE